MSNTMSNVDERTQLAGTNKFELLVFRLNESSNTKQQEYFGINVFKVREALTMPKITPMPGAPQYVMGVANIRGQVIPVIDLPGVVGIPNSQHKILLVTEYERSTQGFAVEDVDEIVRLDWNRVMSAEGTATGSMVTSLARLNEDEDHPKLALVLDVEAILRTVLPSRFKEGEELTQVPEVHLPQGSVILYADDSGVARSQIESTLKKMNIPFIGAKTGQEAWERLLQMDAESQATGKPITEKIALVLTDLEMPQMDGFTLTRKIKESPTLKTIPVVIHSSLSGSANESHATRVGADGYVAKFIPDELAREIDRVLHK